MEIGRLRDGLLETKILTPITVKTEDDEESVVSVEVQFENLKSDGFFLVEPFDYDQISRNNESLIVIPQPYLDGDIIRFRYLESNPSVRKRMQDIESNLSNTDYTIIKAMEEYLLSKPDVDEKIISLIEERKSLRIEYNNLEIKKDG